MKMTTSPKNSTIGVLLLESINCQPILMNQHNVLRVPIGLLFIAFSTPTNLSYVIDVPTSKKAKVFFFLLVLFLYLFYLPALSCFLFISCHYFLVIIFLSLSCHYLLVIIFLSLFSCHYSLVIILLSLFSCHCSLVIILLCYFVIYLLYYYISLISLII